jgi:hypothetical protein
MKHTYLPAPNFHTPPPPRCPVALGQILVNPADPLYTLNAGKVVAPLDSQEIEALPAKGFTATRSQLREHDFKLWANLASLFPVGGGAAASSTASAEDVFTIGRVDTTFFIPSQAYLEASVNAPEVRRYLDGSRWRKPLYMVTGIKVARNAAVASSGAAGSSGRVDSQVDGTSAGIPLAAGFAGRARREDARSTSFRSAGFLLAVELRKIKYRKGKLTESKPHTKGAMFEAGKSQKGAAEPGDDVVVDSLEQDGVAPAGFEDQRFGATGLALSASGDADEDQFCLPLNEVD